MSSSRGGGPEAGMGSNPSSWLTAGVLGESLLTSLCLCFLPGKTCKRLRAVPRVNTFQCQLLLLIWTVKLREESFNRSCVFEDVGEFSLSS